MRSQAGRSDGRAFLIEGLGLGAVDEALENDGAIADAGEGAGGDREVVADEIQLGDFGLFGEIQLVGMGDADLVAVEGEDLGIVVLLAHKIRLHRPILSRRDKISSKTATKFFVLESPCPARTRILQGLRMEQEFFPPRLA